MSTSPACCCQERDTHFLRPCVRPCLAACDSLLPADKHTYSLVCVFPLLGEHVRLFDFLPVCLDDGALRLSLCPLPVPPAFSSGLWQSARVMCVYVFMFVLTLLNVLCAVCVSYVQHTTCRGNVRECGAACACPSRYDDTGHV